MDLCSVVQISDASSGECTSEDEESLSEEGDV